MFRFTDLIIFRMTKACNINCKYCFMKDRPKNTPEAYIKPKMLEAIIDHIAFQRIIANRQNYTLQLVLHGGEVLILGYDRLRHILEYIRSTFNAYGVKYNLSTQTNATLLSKEILQLFAEYVVHVGMSFDGIEGANDARISIKQQDWDTKFSLLRENNVKFGFIMVASKNTVDNQVKSQRYLEQLTEDESFKYKINPAEDMDTPGPQSSIELPGKEFFEKIYKPELERFLEVGSTRESELLDILQSTLIDICSIHGSTRQTGCGSKSCGSALHMIAIEPDGSMDICDRFDRKYDDQMVYMMHALDYDFLGLHQIKRALEFHTINNQVIRDTGCDWCEADYMCKHGCMSFHYSKFNQKWGIDKYIFCDMFQSTFHFINIHLLEFLQAFAKTNKLINNSDPIFEIRESIYDWALMRGLQLAVVEDSDTHQTSIKVQYST
jgi:radical SAM protein with 4Fe4S-binding SPASM domain